MSQEPLRTFSNKNLQELKSIYVGNELLLFRTLADKDNINEAVIVYLNSLVDEKRLNQQILRKMNMDLRMNDGPTGEVLLESLHTLGDVNILTEIDEIENHLADSNFVLFIEGYDEAFGMKLPGFETRAIDEPQIELNIRGPREGFTEDLQKNLGMILRRMKSKNLKAKSFLIGQESQTKVMILYLSDRVDHEVLDELCQRIDSIHLDVLSDSAQIEEWIQDSTFSPFPQILNSERPDRVVTAMNRGKIVIMTDGTPNALITPSTFFEMLHPSEDQFERFYFANFLRIIRLLTLIVSLIGPSFYIAFTTFHLEMIPTPLLMTFLSAKAGIPFPTFIEALIMEVAFEVLREASMRLPRIMGQSVSIVGALIIGEAAVQSGIVSRPMVIVVAMTGIASFTIPSYNTAISLRLLRFPLMFLSALSGMFGLSVGMFIVIFHLCSLRFCGVLFLDPLGSEGYWSAMKKFFLPPVKYKEGLHSEGSRPNVSRIQSQKYRGKDWE
ncbi:spore germination protein [Paenibacillus glycanilyticus]|uniref:spore germination protein n=1 Tax=Paenibacillus glycanilyticus TaxID=126569 RepID=UPI00203A7C48|nr:spore germination protein [Paenibacillus glycanilyticus]MCM3629102.1 spore germination protein [Paenibacillus glycanilyticus]